MEPVAIASAGHPVRVVVADELERPRVMVLFRPLFATPHLLWHGLWSLAVLVAAPVAWALSLVREEMPVALHGFLAAYVRYTTHLWAYLLLLGRKFPGFVGRDGSYGIEAVLPERRSQSRRSVAFRLLLALPALLGAAIVLALLLVVGLVAWLVGLVFGRIPRRLRDFGVSLLRFVAQTLAYVLLLTDRYPLVRR
jgi:hypothetical protein